MFCYNMGMSKRGRPLKSKYSIGDLTPAGDLIVDMRKRPDKFNIKRQKIEGDGYDLKVRCSHCQDPQKDRWTSKATYSFRCWHDTKNIVPNTDSTYKILRASIKSGAKKRGYSYELSFDEFKEVVSQPRHWCGIAPPLKNPKAERMHTLPAPAHGIDRIDNNHGYTYSNSVPSCQRCNVAKNNSTKSEFLSWIERVYAHQFQEVVVA